MLALLAGGVGLPVPEDAVLLAAGWRVWHGDASFAALAPLALLAIVASDVTLYGFGRLARTHPRIARWLERPTVARFVEAYRKRGVRLVLVARVAMGLRAPFFLAAGMAGMPLPRFVGVDALGAAAMTCLWMQVGRWLGPQIGALAPHLHGLALAAAALAATVVLVKARRLVATSAPAARSSVCAPRAAEAARAPRPANRRP